MQNKYTNNTSTPYNSKRRVNTPSINNVSMKTEYGQSFIIELLKEKFPVRMYKKKNKD